MSMFMRTSAARELRLLREHDRIMRATDDGQLVPVSDLIQAVVDRCIPIVRRVGREYGYAIGVHGSLKRDIDLIAVPWTIDATPREELVLAIVDAVGGYVRDELLDSDGSTISRNPEPKPHGRLAWSIHVAGGTYLDLSVMPRASE